MFLGGPLARGRKKKGFFLTPLAAIVAANPIKMGIFFLVFFFLFVADPWAPKKPYLEKSILLCSLVGAIIARPC